MNDLFCKTAITVLGLLPFPIVCFFYFSLPAQVSTQLGSSVTTTNKDSLLYGLVLPLLLLVVYWLIRAKERGNAKSLQYLNLNFLGVIIFAGVLPLQTWLNAYLEFKGIHWGISIVTLKFFPVLLLFAYFGFALFYVPDKFLRMPWIAANISWERLYLMRNIWAWMLIPGGIIGAVTIFFVSPAIVGAVAMGFLLWSGLAPVIMTFFFC